MQFYAMCSRGESLKHILSSDRKPWKTVITTPAARFKAEEVIDGS